MPNWKKLIVSGSDANLNSLNITTDLTGSNALITNDLDVLGNVGIGTTSPEVDLHLSGTSTSFSITDTNITNTSYDTLRFYAASLNKFAIGVGSGTSFPAHIVIDGTSGSVGIGTTSPYDSKLEVTGRIRAAGGTNGGYFFGDEEFDGGFYAPSDGNLAFSTNNVERVRIDGNGKVGIGTTSPQAKLDVAGDVFLTSRNLKISYSGGTTTSFVAAAHNSSGTEGQLKKLSF